MKRDKLDRSVPPEFIKLIKEGTDGHLRIGQFLYSFNSWLSSAKGRDSFDYENDELMILLREYINRKDS